MTALAAAGCCERLRRIIFSQKPGPVEVRRFDFIFTSATWKCVSFVLEAVALEPRVVVVQLGVRS